MSVEFYLEGLYLGSYCFGNEIIVDVIGEKFLGGNLFAHQSLFSTLLHQSSFIFSLFTSFVSCLDSFWWFFILTCRICHWDTNIPRTRYSLDNKIILQHLLFAALQSDLKSQQRIKIHQITDS